MKAWRTLNSSVRCEIGLAGGADFGGVLGAFDAEFALVAAFVKIADRRGRKQVSERAVRRATIEGIDLVEQNAQRRIGAKAGCNFLGARFFHAELAGEKRRVVRLKAIANLLPGERILRGHRERQDGEKQHCAA